MRRFRRSRSSRWLVLPALLFAAGGLVAQPASITGSLGGVVVAEREDRNSDPQLLIATAPERDGDPVDEIQLTMPGRIAKRLTADQLPEGWTLTVKKGRVTLSGPPVEGGAIAIALGLDGAGPIGELDVALYSGGQRLLEGGIATPSWPAVSTEPPSEGLIELPDAAAPGDELTFQPLDPSKTPPGGEWTVDDVPAKWNGDWSQPEYSWSVGAGYKLGSAYELNFKYTDAWGEVLVDGALAGVPIVPVEETDPRISDCSPKVLAGSVFCVCGYFPDAASRTGITINGTPLGAPISASSTVLKFRLPASVSPGPFEIAGLPSGGFAAGSGATGIHVGVGGEIDRERLRSGESTPLRLWLLGTDEAISLRLWNDTPHIVSIDGGDDQTVTTSGGEPNEVRRMVHAGAPGDFLINYKLTLGSCPCAEEMIENVPLLADDGTTVAPALASDLESETPCTEDCEELRRTAEALERHADYLEGLHRRLEGDREWHEEQAGWLDEEIASDRKELANRRRFEGEYRELLESVRRSAKENERRVRELPDGGWEQSLAYDRKLEAERLAKVEEYGRAIQALEDAIEAKAERADELRGLVDEVGEAAAEARSNAVKARQAYEACLQRLPPECVEPPAETLISEGGDDPRDTGEEEEEKPSYCGPDVSRAYLAALHRVYTRMQSVSDDNKGPTDGADFLAANGWNIDQWPAPETQRTPGGEECPSQLCKDGNDVQQLCYKLFGYCVPRHSLNDIMYGFTADLLYVPEAIQNWGGNWAEGAYNSKSEEEKKKYSKNLEGYLYALRTAPEPEISRRAYQVGDELSEDWDPEDRLSGAQIEELLRDGLADFVEELHEHYSWILDCEDCPAEIISTEWSRDWSTYKWKLADGSEQHWKDGEITVKDAPPKTDDEER